MRATVGPLPSAVYWRRRAVVLGALLLVVIVLFVSCGGEDEPIKGKGTAASQAPAPAGAKPETDPSFSDASPGAEPGSDEPAPNASQPATTAASPGTPTGANANANAPADGNCTDAEISTTPIPSAASVKRGGSVSITLKVKNISPRACTRDLGAGVQELYIVEGARKLWSSDTCNPDATTNQVRMQPGSEYTFGITWNGRQSTKCTGALSDGPGPAPGHYELRSRLGTKISDPVTISVTA